MGFDEALFEQFRARVAGSNISSQTLLATDYLNHFNEIVMMLEMVPDMPELLEEARAWEPRGYQDHFRQSTFSDRDLAVEAYEHVPPRYREPFEKTIHQIDNVILTSLDQIDQIVQAGDMELMRIRVAVTAKLVRQLIDVASGIIHGSDRAMDQGEIDGILGSEQQDSGSGGQAEVDALFGSPAPSRQDDIDALFDTPAPSAQDDIDALFGGTPASEPPKDGCCGDGTPTYPSETDALHDNRHPAQPLDQDDIDSLFRD